MELQSKVYGTTTPGSKPLLLLLEYIEACLTLEAFSVYTL